MSLLREIQDAAIDGSIDLETLLRKCRVLASRFQNKAFKLWIQSELDGYQNDVSVPDYRHLHCEAYGNFKGSFQQILNHAKIPETFIPEDQRERLTHLDMRQGVSSLMDMIKNTESALLQMKWQPESYAHFGNAIYQNMRLFEAWIAIPQGAVIGIVHTVRNRILNFVLEVESHDPLADERVENGRTISDDKISEIFYDYLFLGTNSLTSDHNITRSIREKIHTGDLNSLETFLTEVGFNEEEIEALQEALANDNPPLEDKFGKDTAEWIGNAVSKVAQGDTRISTSVASKVLSEAIRFYYEA